MTISQRIFSILKEKKLKQKDMADYTGISTSAISAWNKNNTNPAAESISIIADFLGVSIEYLLTGEEKAIVLKDDEKELLTYYKKLPERDRQRLIGRASALADLYEEQLNQKKYITLKTNIRVYDTAAGAGISTPFIDDDKYTIQEYAQTDVPSNADCGIYISGDSMEPKFPNGCLVWVKETQDIKFGDIIIAILNGEPFCKIYQADGLYSVNPKYDPILVNENDTFSVFGRVLGYYVE